MKRLGFYKLTPTHQTFFKRLFNIPTPKSNKIQAMRWNIIVLFLETKILDQKNVLMKLAKDVDRKKGFLKIEKLNNILG